ncbi:MULTISPECIES: 2Fe-2S iron-sulfur cluster-binding protein [unclassified Bradyrhizobium]|uniref:2Fe-2S iron-sulfur cluster-binding protein n=1 Tax=unclassified Bradyrhizobium TaxID=2631580 RepID=UPI001BA85384|nr:MULTISPECIES: 2Fe-2S iron-sulfur cluster-binding protein [unclassified Bradyrhizobium]MBR1208759.1 2Fe-2S iron-sulfur cluster binding domain-containing protein [Bradyrhizobium sp. AUGA SZCCT0124]MBR1316952.1 2Fe-2S iron-sulfur cluster binding domain-containing protein [Bradyrhizobium sp. AUGA SZCCT0051]MBR1345252.1 2Fe-2S iron-sulfur cluster binding domain-containing protein [Bradyrhizobium sp. AUGA SZCCT0105]MBR1360046.1 2Fe-2S iron-sulfur cluster binding domain-containing protein [Bradyrhi
MITITFIHPNGRHECVEGLDGESVMLAATQHGLVGVVAECGGNAMCATCHVYVDEAWLSRLPGLGSEEDALLDGVADERLPSSRLSCQIRLKPELDGLVMRLPERQT